MEFFLLLLPQSKRKNFFFFLAKVAFYLDKKHKNVINTNLDIAGITDLKVRNECMSYCYKNLLLNFFQTLDNKLVKKDEAFKKITTKNQDIVDVITKENRPIIFVTAHYGNWEFIGMALMKCVPKLSIVYKKLNDEHFDKYLHDIRVSTGVKMIEKRGALRGVTKVLKNGESLGLLIDQNTSIRDGIVVDFFSKTARASATAAQIARKYDAVIVPVFITTEDEDEYVVNFKEPIIVDKTENIEADILKATQAQATAIQMQIKEQPKFWFWCHKRWKTEHPELYK
ncbi:MAG: lipid A biosynthesis acyltransferase [Helicobacteraceae bacterium]|nr:lipid A biosynthesis acyltransferase [Helicobacteraceae bacterium]